MKRLAAVLAAIPLGVAAQAVALQGMLGSKALLIVDGDAPRAVAPGESHKGVRVLSTQGDQAVVEVGGERHTLRVGDAPASVGARRNEGPGSRIVLKAGSGGHFFARGSINGRAVEFLVDTGATAVAIGAKEAERLGIDYRKGPRVPMSTANGVVNTWRVRLDSVRIGDVEVFGVDGIVVPSGMSMVLLGNSFLSRFHMQRENDQLVLERRY